MTNLYKKGQKVRVKATQFEVYDDGTDTWVPTDPTTVKCVIKAPDGTVTTYVYGTDVELVKDGAGVYHLDVVANQNKRWHYRYEGTGTCTAVEEGSFQVRSAFS